MTLKTTQEVTMNTVPEIESEWKIVEYGPHGLQVHTRTYALTLDLTRPFALRTGGHGHAYADLFLGSSLNTTSGLDRTARLNPLTVPPAAGAVTLRPRLGGGIWHGTGRSLQR